MLKNVSRLISRLEKKFEIPELSIASIKKNAIEVDLAPYQIIFVNPQKLSYLSTGISFEETVGGLVELCFHRDERKGTIFLSDAGKIISVKIEEFLGIRKDEFLLATSKVKILEGEGFLEATGEGSVVLQADEIIELENEEEVLVAFGALVAFSNGIQKELVKIGKILIWRVKGPGMCAVKWNYMKEVDGKKEVPKIEDQKEMIENEPKKKESLLSEILSSNHILL